MSDKRPIPVTGFSIQTGEPTVSFKSIQQANDIGGFTRERVGQVLDNVRRHHAGYVWVRTGQTPCDVCAFKKCKGEK